MGMFGQGLGRLIATGVMGTREMARMDEQKRQQQMLADKQKFAQLLAGKLGPQYAETQGAGAAVAAGADYQWKPPERTSNGLDINSPDLPSLLMQAENAGYDMKGLVDVLDKQRPAWQAGPDGSYVNTRGSAAPRAAAVNGIRPTADGGAEAVQGYAGALSGIEIGRAHV